MRQKWQKITKLFNINKAFYLPERLKKEIKRFIFSFFWSIVCATLIFDFLLIHYPLTQTNLDLIFQIGLTHSTNFLLNLSGFNTYLQVPYLAIQGCQGIIFAPECLGLRHITIFSVFIITYMGKWRIKLLYIFVGSIILILVNIIRAYIIALSQYFDPTKTDLIHDIASPPLMYLTILFLWILWMEKWGSPPNYDKT